METTIEVHEPSQVGEVRRAAEEMARAEGMGVTEMGRVALMATEVSTNLVKYAKRGAVTLSKFAEAGRCGIEIVATDHGPGFADFAASLRDGHSTSGSLGVGLGSIKRASSYFDVYTVAGQGSAVLARLVKAAPAAGGVTSDFITAARSVPKRAQLECGDAWEVRDFGARQLICIVDGLGHGPLAAFAAARAIEVFDAAAPTDTPADILLRAHEQLKDTRGVVMAVLALDAAAGTATFSGVGNIAAVIVQQSGPEHLLSIEGIAGYNLRKARSQTASWKANAVAILNTDGLSGRWNLAKYPGLLARHPSLIASVLFRDHARDTDDATILVVKGM